MNNANLSLKQIDINIIKIKKEIIELKIQMATKQNLKKNILKSKKHELAQLLTLETFKKTHKYEK